jgi:hypothetical protein
LNSQQILHSVTHQNSREIGKFTEQVLPTAVSEESSKYQFIVRSSPDIKTETFSETCVLVFPPLTDFASQQSRVQSHSEWQISFFQRH